MDESTESRLAHLLRRAGFGASRDQIAYYARKGVDGSVDELINYQSVPNPIDAERPEPAGDQLTIQDIREWWITRMLYTARPLEEKMTLFWHGHFATASYKVRNVDYMLGQNELFRANALGNFRTLTKEAARDPAMVIWLDNFRNRVGRPNENFGRELMELFTLGIGHYTEEDVKQAARAFTGWFARPKGGGFLFLPRAHDFGEKTFLGRTGNFDGDDIIDIILDQEAAPRFLARKLVAFFMNDEPSDSLVAPYAKLLRENDYEIKPVMERMLRSEAFYAPGNRQAVTKSPADFVIGTMRMVSGPIPSEQLRMVSRRISYFMHQMGQDLFTPPNVKGWNGGQAWITTNAVLARANLIAVLLGARPAQHGGLRQPQSLADPDALFAGVDAQNPHALADRLVQVLGSTPLRPATRSALVDFFKGETGSSESLQTALQMAMVSPEFQMA